MRLALLFVFGLFSLLLLRQTHLYGADWAPLWTAGKLSLSSPEMVYAFDLVTKLQPEPFSGLQDRPYIYPPSALPVFAAFSLVPFWMSFALFSLAALAWFAWVSNRVGSDALLVVAAPPVVLAAMAGQPTLLVAGLVILACASRPVAAGVLFGTAAMIKPTLLVLAPVALIAGRQWTTIRVAAATAGLGAVVTAAAFGWESWALWLDALPRFQRLFAEDPLLLRHAVTPYALGVRLGFESVWIIVFMAAIAIPAIWFSFATGRSAIERSAILMGGALIVSPYAMFYELAVLAPLVASRLKPIDSVIAAIWAICLFANASVAGLIAVLGNALSSIDEPSTD